MRVDLQSSGSYTYECRKAECFHCAMMGLNPLPALPEEVQFIYLETRKPKILAHKHRKLNSWNQSEIRIILKNKFLPSCDIKKLLPLRTIKAVDVMKCRLRKSGELVTF